MCFKSPIQGGNHVNEKIARIPFDKKIVKLPEKMSTDKEQKLSKYVLPAGVSSTENPYCLKNGAKSK